MVNDEKVKRSILTTATLITMGLAPLTGCGAQTQAASSSQAVESPAFFFDQVQRARSRGIDAVEPTNLTQALPHTTPAIAGLPGNARPFTDAIVFGHVDSVEPGVGYDYSSSGSSTTEVAFDDSRADAHDVLVTLKVDHVVGKATGTSVAFRMGVLGNADAEKFMASLRGLGDVVILLKQIPDGPHTGELYPILGGAGVATVDEAEQLDFPGLGAQAETFAHGITTPAQLMAAASPSWPGPAAQSPAGARQ